MTTQRLLRIAAAKRHGETGTGRAIRLNAGLTLADVAQVVGRSESAVHRWETGVFQPRGDAAVKWAKLLAELQRAANAANVA